MKKLGPIEDEMIDKDRDWEYRLFVQISSHDPKNELGAGGRIIGLRVDEYRWGEPCILYP